MTPTPRRAREGTHIHGTPFYRVWERGWEFIDHRRGVAWHDAPRPERSHRCEVQTRGRVRVQGLPLMSISRCRCGAVDLHDGCGWIEKNSRSS